MSGGSSLPGQGRGRDETTVRIRDLTRVHCLLVFALGVMLASGCCMTGSPTNNGVVAAHGSLRLDVVRGNVAGFVGHLVRAHLPETDRKNLNPVPHLDCAVQSDGSVFVLVTDLLPLTPPQGTSVPDGARSTLTNGSPRYFPAEPLAVLAEIVGWHERPEERPGQQIAFDIAAIRIVNEVSWIADWNPGLAAGLQAIQSSFPVSKTSHERFMRSGLWWQVVGDKLQLDGVDRAGAVLFHSPKTMECASLSPGGKETLYAGLRDCFRLSVEHHHTSGEMEGNDEEKPDDPLSKLIAIVRSSGGTDTGELLAWTAVTTDAAIAVVTFDALPVETRLAMIREDSRLQSELLWSEEVYEAGHAPRYAVDVQRTVHVAVCFAPRREGLPALLKQGPVVINTRAETHDGWFDYAREPRYVIVPTTPGQCAPVCFVHMGMTVVKFERWPVDQHDSSYRVRRLQPLGSQVARIAVVNELTTNENRVNDINIGTRDAMLPRVNTLIVDGVLVVSGRCCAVYEFPLDDGASPRFEVDGLGPVEWKEHIGLGGASATTGLVRAQGGSTGTLLGIGLIDIDEYWNRASYFKENDEPRVFATGFLLEPSTGTTRSLPLSESANHNLLRDDPMAEDYTRWDPRYSFYRFVLSVSSPSKSGLPSAFWIADREGTCLLATVTKSR
jgi:hypothetical protein